MSTKKVTNEEAKMTIEEVEAKIEKMLKEAEEKAKRIAEGKTVEEFTENELS